MRILNQRFLPTIIVLVLLAVLSRAHGASQDNWQWGEPAKGLQLGVALDATNGVLHCRVRNAGNQDITYNDVFFGLRSYVRLEIREGTNWVWLSDFGMAIFPGQQFESCAGPIGGKTEVLQPGQVLTKTNQRRADSLLHRPKREEWLATISAEDTFVLDLASSRWPKEISDLNQREFRLSQIFASPANTFSERATSYSAVFSLPETATRKLKPL